MNDSYQTLTAHLKQVHATTLDTVYVVDTCLINDNHSFEDFTCEDAAVAFAKATTEALIKNKVQATISVFTINPKEKRPLISSAFLTTPKTYKLHSN